MKSAIATLLLSIGSTLFSPTAIGLSVAQGAWLNPGLRSPQSPNPALPVLVADRRATDTCVDAIEDRGLRVLEIIAENEYSGGTEVILRVRGRNETYRVGCDYASGTREVQLYRIEGNDNETDRDRFNDREDRLNRSDDEVRDRRDAEDIARQAIQDRLEVDANSEVIKIDEAQERGREWRVRGRVNGAPFEVRIRSSDGSIEGFALQ